MRELSENLIGDLRKLVVCKNFSTIVFIFFVFFSFCFCSDDFPFYHIHKNAYILLDQDWLFRWDEKNNGMNEKWWSNDFSKNDWKKIILPAVWDQNPGNFSPKTKTGIGWFCKKLIIPESWRGDISILFLSVMYSADIWLNGEYVLKHNGGFTPFFVNIKSDKIKAQDRSVELVLRVDNTLSNQTIPSSKHGWNTYGGICREVYLINQPKFRIEDLKIQTTIKGNNKAALKISGTLKGFKQEDDLAIFAKIKSGEEYVSQLELQISEENNGNHTFETNATLNSPRLWSPEDPFLYTLEFYSGTNSIFSIPIGVREIKIDGQRFLLNGKEYWLQGFGQHEDMKNSGPIIDSEFLETEIRRMKNFGANHIRTGHYPHHPKTYAICDSMGLLAFAEIPAWQIDRKWANTQEAWDEWGAPQLKEMIDFYRHFPSIVSWSASNEMGGAYSFNKRGVEYISQLDETRIPTVVVDATYYPEIYEIIPFAGRNLHYGLYHSKRVYDGLRKGLPENIGYSQKFGIPLWISELGGKAWRGRYNSSYASDLRDTEFYADKNLRFAFQYSSTFSDAVCGISIWTWSDFYERRGSICCHGIFDIERNPKIMSYSARNIFYGKLRLYICEDDSTCQSGGDFSAQFHLFNPERLRIPNGLKVRWLILKNQKILTERNFNIPEADEFERSIKLDKISWKIPPDSSGFFSLWAELLAPDNSQLYCNWVHFGTSEEDSPGILHFKPSMSEKKNEIYAYALFDWMKIPVYDNLGLIIPLSPGKYKFKILKNKSESEYFVNIEAGKESIVNE